MLEANDAEPENGTGAPSSGGQGGLDSLSQTAGQTSDTRMIARAIRERWPINPEHRAKVVERMVGILDSDKASFREQTSAAKALISADAQNVAQEKGHLPMPGGVNVNVGINIGSTGDREHRVAVLAEQLRVAGPAAAAAGSGSAEHPGSNGSVPHANGKG